MFKKSKILFDNFTTELNECHVSAYASSASFFMLLSIIPMLILLCSILPYTPITENDLIEVITTIVPASMSKYVMSTVRSVYDRSIAVVSVSALVTIWTAGKGMVSIIRGLNSINKCTVKQNYIFMRLRGCIYTLLFLIIIILSLFLGVFGELITNKIETYFPRIELLSPLFINLRLIFIFGLLCLFFISLFTFVPNRKIDWKTQIVGAIFVALTWSGFSWGFSIYVKYFTGEGIYGNMTTLILLMLWFYFNFYLMFYGALISKFLEPATSFLIDRASQKKVL